MKYWCREIDTDNEERYALCNEDRIVAYLTVTEAQDLADSLNIAVMDSELNVNGEK